MSNTEDTKKGGEVEPVRGDAHRTASPSEYPEGTFLPFATAVQYVGNLLSELRAAKVNGKATLTFSSHEIQSLAQAFHSLRTARATLAARTSAALPAETATAVPEAPAEGSSNVLDTLKSALEKHEEEECKGLPESVWIAFNQLKAAPDPRTLALQEIVRIVQEWRKHDDQQAGEEMTAILATAENALEGK